MNETAREDGTYIYFQAAGDGWLLLNKQSQELLGAVRWYAHWRRYVVADLVYGVVLDAVCLREIADFLDRKAKERR